MSALTDHLPSIPQRKPLDREVLDAANILIFDIETTPATVQHEVYDLKMRNPYIHHGNVVKPGAMLCWSAQWFHEPNRVMYRDIRHPDMLTDLWRLLDHASYVVGYNSDRFDLRKVRGYFAREGLPPIRPPKSIDLIKTSRTLGFESASLDYSCRMFGVRRKIDNGGASLWRRCVEDDDPKAWRDMRTYNVGDVRATTELFMAMLPIMRMPVVGYPDDQLRCPRCGSTDVHDDGAFQAQVIRYRAYRCHGCTGVFRTTFHSRISTAHAVH